MRRAAGDCGKIREEPRGRRSVNENQVSALALEPGERGERAEQPPRQEGTILLKGDLAIVDVPRETEYSPRWRPGRGAGMSRRRKIRSCTQPLEWPEAVEGRLPLRLRRTRAGSCSRERRTS